jgi:hypothetical protein
VAPQKTNRIYIDSEPIEAEGHRLTGAEIRNLTSPPAENLWLDIPDAQDRAITPSQIVVIKDGLRFFTDRPRTIYLDRVAYQVRSAVITEAQLRQLPTPPVAEDHGVWKDVPDDLDDPVRPGELVPVADGDRFFTKELPNREIGVVVNRRPVKLHGAHQTGMTIKQAAIAQAVPIQPDFLLSRKENKKYRPIGDDETIRVHAGDDFRALDGDDNS